MYKKLFLTGTLEEIVASIPNIEVITVSSDVYDALGTLGIMKVETITKYNELGEPYDYVTGDCNYKGVPICENPMLDDDVTLVQVDFKLENTGLKMTATCRLL